MKRLRRSKGPVTNREKEILILLFKGGSVKSIAFELGVSRRTIDFHVNNLLRKFDSPNRNDLIYKAIHKGLIPGVQLVKEVA